MHLLLEITHAYTTSACMHGKAWRANDEVTASRWSPPYNCPGRMIEGATGAQPYFPCRPGEWKRKIQGTSLSGVACKPPGVRPSLLLHWCLIFPLAGLVLVCFFLSFFTHAVHWYLCFPPAIVLHWV